MKALEIKKISIRIYFQLGLQMKFYFYAELRILKSPASTAEQLINDIAAFLESSGRIKENGDLANLKLILGAPRWHPQVNPRQNLHILRLLGAGL